MNFPTPEYAVQNGPQQELNSQLQGYKAACYWNKQTEKEMYGVTLVFETILNER